MLACHRTLQPAAEPRPRKARGKAALEPVAEEAEEENEDLLAQADPEPAAEAGTAQQAAAVELPTRARSSRRGQKQQGQEGLMEELAGDTAVLANDIYLICVCNYAPIHPC